MAEKVGRDVATDKFVSEYVANGGNATAAYRVAFPKSLKWTEKSVNERASKYLSSAKVQSRLVAIRNATVSSTIATAAERKEILSRIARSLGEEQTKDVISAIKVLAQMEGDFAPTKVEVDMPMLVRDFASCGGAEE